MRCVMRNYIGEVYVPETTAEAFLLEVAADVLRHEVGDDNLRLCHMQGDHNWMIVDENDEPTNTGLVAVAVVTGGGNRRRLGFYNESQGRIWIVADAREGRGFIELEVDATEADTAQAKHDAISAVAKVQSE